MKYLSDYTKEAQTELFTNLGAFFAFSNEQLNAKRVKCIKYVSLGSGLICPKVNAATLHLGLREVQAAGIKADIAENGINAIIKRELYNHEAFYTGEIEDTIDALEDYDVTREQVMAIYRAEYDTAAEQF